jgi:hypothetical protein
MQLQLTSGKRLLVFALVSAALVLPCSAQRPIGYVVASDATVKGSVAVVSTGTRVMSGSSVTAGQGPASLRLLRGGEVRICPRASVSLTNSHTGRDLVLGMGTGVIETHYALNSTADTILTPDFRILLAGPARFHVAIGADARGNTCVRSLEGSNGSILITEMMGDGVYQVHPGEQAYFRDGKIASVDGNVPPDCGCPPAEPVMTAEPQPAPTPAIPFPQSGAAPAQPVPSAPAQQGSVEIPANSPEAILAQHGTLVPALPNVTPTVAPPPNAVSQNVAVPQAAAPPEASGASNVEAQVRLTSPDNDLHVQVDAPFVYRAEDSAPPAPIVARLTLRAMPALLSDSVAVAPPDTVAATPRAANTNTPSNKPQRKSFFGHMRSFFASIFK